MKATEGVVEEKVFEEKPRVREVVVENMKPNVEQSRGKKLGEQSRKRKNPEHLKTTEKVPKCAQITHEHKEQDRSKLIVDTHKFKEPNREHIYIHHHYQVVVKEIDTKDSMKEELEPAKREVMHEATVPSELGNHSRITPPI